MATKHESSEIIPVDYKHPVFPDFKAIKKRLTAKHIATKTDVFKGDPETRQRFISYWIQWVEEDLKAVWDEVEKAQNISARIIKNGDPLI